MNLHSQSASFISSRRVEPLGGCDDGGATRVAEGNSSANSATEKRMVPLHDSRGRCMVRRISDDASEECLVLPCALTGERCRMLSDPDDMRRLNSLDASHFVTNSAESCDRANRKVLSPRQVRQEEITSESGRTYADERGIRGRPLRQTRHKRGADGVSLGRDRPSFASRSVARRLPLVSRITLSRYTSIFSQSQLTP